jgi:alpha-ribazole phosphatase
MARLLFVRHGNTEFNSARRFMGHSDIELSSEGRRQIELLRDYLTDENIAAVYSSDLARTMASARILAASRGLEVVPCPELREMHYGVCEGLTFGEIGQNYPDVARQCAYFTPELEFPEGETFHNFARRVVMFLDRLAPLTQTDRVLIVSHNGPIKVLICHLIGISQEHWWQIRTDTASLSIVDTTPRGGVLSRLNDVSYLK